MTTRALVRTARFDVNAARDSLRGRASSQELVLDGRRVRIFREPLFKRSESGDLLQSVRIDVAGGHTVTTAVVRTPSGAPIASRIEQGPAGIRLLVPEVREPTTILVELPELSPANMIEVELHP